MKRCDWCLGSEQMIRYHDTEWGVPLHEDKKLFEFMVLDAFQAGLSWSTVLHKRKNFEKAFDGFSAIKIAKYNKEKIKKLLKDAGIIRNRLKIFSAVENAKQFLRIQQEHGSFDQFLWQFVNHQPIQNKWKVIKQLPARSKESDRMGEALKKEGFKFVGSTICYAFMQAAGMVNDHLVGCFRHAETKKMHKETKKPR